MLFKDLKYICGMYRGILVQNSFEGSCTLMLGANRHVPGAWLLAYFSPKGISFACHQAAL